MKKIIIQELAQFLNLPTNTVSKALCNSEAVSYKTRRLVVRKAVEMGYLKTSSFLEKDRENEGQQKKYNIAVLAHIDCGDFWNSIILGISNELSRNKSCLLFNVVNKEDEENKNIPYSVLNNNIDGIILISVFKDDYIRELSQTKIPIVYLDISVDMYNKSLKGDLLLIDGERKVYEITKYLIEKGCQQIGFIGDTSYSKTIYDRWRGFKEAMLNSKMEIDERICFHAGIESRYYKYDDVAKCLASVTEMPQAFVCANDHIAVLVTRYRRNHPDKMPFDILVTGFDETREALILEPDIITVRVSTQMLGRRLAQTMLWRINNPEMPYEVVYVEAKTLFKE